MSSILYHSNLQIQAQNYMNPLQQCINIVYYFMAHNIGHFTDGNTVSRGVYFEPVSESNTQ